MGQPYPAPSGCQGPPPGFRPHRRRGAEVVQHTLRAPRRPGNTDPTPVQDQAQAEPGPFRRRDQFRYVGFDLDWVGTLGQTEAPGEPLDVGIDGEARNAEGDTQHDVGGLAPDAGKRDQVLDTARDLAVEALDPPRAGGDDRLRLPWEETGGVDPSLGLPRVPM